MIVRVLIDPKYAPTRIDARWLVLFIGVFIVFAYYLVWCTLTEVSRPWRRQPPKYVAAKIVVPTLVFSIYYWLPSEPRGEPGFLLLYLLPLFVSIAESSFRSVVCVTFSIWLLSALLPIVSRSDTREWEGVLFDAAVPRAFFLAFLAAAGSLLWQVARERVRLYRLLLNRVKAGIRVVDADKRILYVNAWERRYAGVQPVGRTCNEAFNESEKPCPNVPNGQVLEPNASLKPNLITRTKGDKEYILEVKSKPFRDRRDRVIGAISAITDVTDHERREQRLAILQEAGSAALSANLSDDGGRQGALRGLLEVLTDAKGLGCARAFLLSRPDDSPVLTLALESTRVAEGYPFQCTVAPQPPNDALVAAWQGSGWVFGAHAQAVLDSEDWRTMASSLGATSWNPLVLTPGILAADPWLHLADALGLGRTTGSASAIVAPLHAMGDLTGLIVAEPWPYGTADQESVETGFLRLCALQASHILESARLSTELADLPKWQSRLQQALEEAYSRTRSGGPQERRESPLAPPLRRAVQLVRAAAGTIYLMTPARDRLVAATVYPAGAISPKPLNLGQDVAGLAAQGEVVLQVDDYQVWCAAHPDQLPSTTRAEIRALIAVPLRFRNTTLGVLEVAHQDAARAFGPADSQILERRADGIAAAIGNARDHVQLQTLVDRLPVPLIAVDEDGKVTQFNQAAEALTGRKWQDTLGTSVQSYYVGGMKTAKAIGKRLHEENAKRKPLEDERTEIRHADGRAMPILLSGALTADERGEPSGSLAVMVDLGPRTEQERREAGSRELLAELSYASPEEQIKTQEGLRERTGRMLARAGQHLGCNYLLLLASAKENHTVLTPVADWWTSAPENLLGLQFDWRKAGLLNRGTDGRDNLNGEAETLTGWHTRGGLDPNLMKGLSRAWAERLSDMDYAVPIRLADSYRALLIFGAAGRQQSVTERRRLQRSIAEAVARDVLSRIQTLALTAERETAQQAARLVLHRTSMQLLHVTGLFGAIKSAAHELPAIRVAAETGEEVVDNLAAVIATGLVSRYAELELKDYHFRPYPLTALVQNCAESFQGKARQSGRELVVDSSVARLPEALVDPAALFAALANLVDNAIKYGYQSTRVRIFSDCDTSQATITVEDHGERMPDAATKNLHGLRGRYGMSPRARQLPGWGLGLWDANAVVSAHGGAMGFTCEPAGPVAGRRSWRVRIWMRIPLRQQN